MLNGSALTLFSACRLPADEVAPKCKLGWDQRTEAGNEGQGLEHELANAATPASDALRGVSP